MYKIEKTGYGAKLTFSGLIKADEMEKWRDEFKAVLPAKGVFVDMRDLKPLPKESQSIMEDGQKLGKKKGMQRSVVILNSSLIKMQFTRIGKETGIYEWERYIDASSVPNWEQVGIDWLVDGVDPDK